MSDVVVGIRLTADGSDLVGEVRLSSAELNKLAGSSRKAGTAATDMSRRVGQLETEVKKLRGQLARARKEQSGFVANAQKMRGAITAVGAALAAMGVARFIREWAQVNMAFEQTQNSFRAAFGGAGSGAQEMDFIRGQAQRLGLELLPVADSYAQIAAAARGTNLEGQQTREIFLSIVEAGTALGRSSADIAGMLRAVQQMISKGNVSAEELRQQLGERLPGAVGLAAKALGVTTSELNKMLEQGEVLAEDLLPKLAKELRATYGPEAEKNAGSLRAEMNRVRNEADEFLRLLGESGAKEAAAGGLRELAAIMSGINGLLDEANAGSATWLSHLQGIGRTLLGVLSMGGSELLGLGLGRLGDAGRARLEAQARFTKSIEPNLVTPGRFGTSTGGEFDFKLPPKPPKPPGGGGGRKREDVLEVLRREVEMLDRLTRARQISGEAAEKAAVQNRILELARKNGIRTGTERFRQLSELVTRVHELQTAEEKAEKAAKRDAETRKEVTRRILEMGPAYDQATKKAEAWRTEALAGLDATKAGYEEFRAQIDTVFNGMMAEAFEESLNNSKEWQAGVIRGFREVAGSAGDTASVIEDTITGGFDKAKSALKEFVKTGKVDLADLADFAIDIGLELALSGIASGFGGQGGGAAGGIAGFFAQILGIGAGPSVPNLGLPDFGSIGGAPFHGGGTVGASQRATRQVPASTYANAPRLHKGLLPGEFAAILKKGEGVFTPEHMDNAGRLISALAAGGAGGGTQIQIIDQRGRDDPAPEVSTSRGSDGRELVTVFLRAAADDVRDGGQLGRAVKAVSSGAPVGA